MGPTETQLRINLSIANWECFMDSLLRRSLASSPGFYRAADLFVFILVFSETFGLAALECLGVRDAG